MTRDRAPTTPVRVRIEYQLVFRLSAVMMRLSMHPMRRQFFALSSDCARYLQAQGARQGEEAAVAAIDEIARIEVGYPRYRTLDAVVSAARAARRGNCSPLINLVGQSLRSRRQTTTSSLEGFAT
jgi:hypothetical protein